MNVIYAIVDSDSGDIIGIYKNRQDAINAINSDPIYLDKKLTMWCVAGDYINMIKYEIA